MTESSPGPPPLVLIAHGSRDPAAAACCERIAAGVRATWSPKAGPDVHLCYLDHGALRPGDVLAALPAGAAVLVPLLLATAFHVQVDIEAAAERARAGGRRVTVAPALAPHPLLLSAANALLAQTAGPQKGVVLASAGTSDPVANALTAAIAQDLGQLRGASVLAAFAAGAPPSVTDAIAALRRTQKDVAVLTWVLAPGRFADLIAAAATAAGVPSTPVLGLRPEIAALVRTRYDAARPRD